MWCAPKAKLPSKSRPGEVFYCNDSKEIYFSVADGSLLNLSDLLAGALPNVRHVGPQGQPGERGEKGDQGFQGERGEKGTPGKDGKDGLPGPRGERGEKGDKGDQGIQGIQGIQGLKGDPGPKGDIGPAGVNVAAGQQCTQGSVIGFDNGGNIICKSVPQTYAIGDKGPAGGIVFYITDGGLHGLEAAPQDQSSGGWGCDGTYLTGAHGTAVGTGAQNTADILAGCSEPGIAARIADGYTLNGYYHWFLPSKDELNLLYQHKGVVGGFATASYWSSTEYAIDDTCSQNFSTGGQYYYDKYTTLEVRAVRAF